MSNDSTEPDVNPDYAEPPKRTGKIIAKTPGFVIRDE